MSKGRLKEIIKGVREKRKLSLSFTVTAGALKKDSPKITHCYE